MDEQKTRQMSSFVSGHFSRAVILMGHRHAPFFWAANERRGKFRTHPPPPQPDESTKDHDGEEAAQWRRQLHHQHPFRGLTGGGRAAGAAAAAGGRKNLRGRRLSHFFAAALHIPVRFPQRASDESFHPFGLLFVSECFGNLRAMPFLCLIAILLTHLCSHCPPPCPSRLRIMDVPC